MNNKYYFILMYTFSQVSVYSDFIDALQGKFKLEQLDQSTYALTGVSQINDVKTELSSIINNLKSKGITFAQNDFVNLYYAEGLTDHNDSKKDKIIRWNINLQ